MIRRWIRQHLPSADHFDRIPVFRHFKKHLSHPNLWALNRRSVAGGVAAGLFCGLIPGPFQIFGALIWGLVGKVNLPVAFVVTLYTNPLTIVPLYILAVAYGDFILGEADNKGMHPLPDWSWADFGGSTHALLDWMLSLGPSLAVGLPAMMTTLSILGYLAVRIAWSAAIRLAAAKRHRAALNRKN